MPGVVYYAAASLDGYIAESDDSIDWLTQYDGGEPDADPMDGHDGFYAGVGAPVSGSVTYEWILANAGDWPYPGKPYWVLTPRELPGVEGQDVRFNGSHELLAQVRVTVVPVVLGAGKPLFERRLAGPPTRLAGVVPRASGMVELRYDRLPA